VSIIIVSGWIERYSLGLKTQSTLSAWLSVLTGISGSSSLFSDNIGMIDSRFSRLINHRSIRGVAIIIAERLSLESAPF